jgi:hypothetical protein
LERFGGGERKGSMKKKKRKEKERGGRRRGNGLTSTIAAVRRLLLAGIYLTLAIDVMWLLWWRDDDDGSSASGKQQAPGNERRRRRRRGMGPSINTSQAVITSQQQQTPKGAVRRKGREFVAERLRRAGVSETELRSAWGSLPTWERIVEQYGEGPVLALSSATACEDYRGSVPGVRRTVGTAGMFSTGTNLVTSLLKKNCRIPERVAAHGANATKEQLGMRWQVRTCVVVDDAVCAKVLSLAWTGEALNVD